MILPCQLSVVFPIAAKDVARKDICNLQKRSSDLQKHPKKKQAGPGKANEQDKHPKPSTIQNAKGFYVSRTDGRASEEASMGSAKQNI
jgi:hypothetical protein